MFVVPDRKVLTHEKKNSTNINSYHPSGSKKWAISLCVNIYCLAINAFAFIMNKKNTFFIFFLLS